MIGLSRTWNSILELRSVICMITMMDLFNFDYQSLFSFFLTLIRTSILLFLLPFFGGKGLPQLARIALCLVLSIAIWPVLHFPGNLLPGSVLGLLFMIFGELSLGLVMGMVVRFVFAGIQTAGQLLGFQMGFAMMSVVDPMSGSSVTLTAQFLYLLSLLIFLSLNGHLYLLSALFLSFKLVPPGQVFVSSHLGTKIMALSGQIFVLALKIAAPVVVSVFLVDLALGIVARVAPQINVLFVGFPIKIAVGFLFFGIIILILNNYLQEFIVQLGPIFKGLMLLSR